MKELQTRLPGVRLFELQAFSDERGFFLETYRAEWAAMLGVAEFIQDNHSRSRRGTVRGLHYQIGEGQAKLVRVVRGSIFDVVVDLRRTSPTYCQWEAFDLDDVSHRTLYIPVGFAHGFSVLSIVADVAYKVSRPYDPGAERTLVWNDGRVGVEWPERDPLLSPRDAAAPTLTEIEPELDAWAGDGEPGYLPAR